MVSKILELFYVIFKNSKRLDCEKIIRPSKKIMFSAYVIIIFFTGVQLFMFHANFFNKQHVVIANILTFFLTLINLILIFTVVKEILCNYILIYKERIKVVQNVNINIIKNEEIIDIIQRKINSNELETSLTVLTKNQEYNINVKMFLQKDIDYFILLLGKYINVTSDGDIKKDINNIGDTSKKKNQSKKKNEEREIIHEMIFGAMDYMLLAQLIGVIVVRPWNLICDRFNLSESVSSTLLIIIYIVTEKYHINFSNYMSIIGVSKKIKTLAFIFTFFWMFWYGRIFIPMN